MSDITVITVHGRHSPEVSLAAWPWAVGDPHRCAVWGAWARLFSLQHIVLIHTSLTLSRLTHLSHSPLTVSRARSSLSRPCGVRFSPVTRELSLLLHTTVVGWHPTVLPPLSVFRETCARCRVLTHRGNDTLSYCYSAVRPISGRERRELLSAALLPRVGWSVVDLVVT